MSDESSVMSTSQMPFEDERKHGRGPLSAARAGCSEFR